MMLELWAASCMHVVCMGGVALGMALGEPRETREEEQDPHNHIIIHTAATSSLSYKFFSDFGLGLL